MKSKEMMSGLSIRIKGLTEIGGNHVILQVFIFIYVTKLRVLIFIKKCISLQKHKILKFVLNLNQ